MTQHINKEREVLTRMLPTEAATAALGTAIAPTLRAGMVIYVRGQLGAGKTTLVRGILTALGVRDRIKSPTYTLVEPYSVSSLYLYHFDFYRLRHPDEWLEAGFREYFGGNAICIIEWPEKAGSKLPHPDVAIDIAVTAGGRTIVVSATTEAGETCLRALQS